MYQLLIQGMLTSIGFTSASFLRLKVVSAQGLLRAFHHSRNPQCLSHFLLGDWGFVVGVIGIFFLE